MGKYPLTNKQIEFCDYILSISQQKLNRRDIPLKEISNTDIQIAAGFLKENHFVTSLEIVLLTEKGVKYSKKGLVKYFRNQKRDELLNSTIFKTFSVWIPIIIALLFGVCNFCQNHKNKRNESYYVKYTEIDSILNKKGFKDCYNPNDKFAIDKISNDSIK